MLVPFSHICKQWGRKAFTSHSEYIVYFLFPFQNVFLEYRRQEGPKACFYFGALNTGEVNAILMTTRRSSWYSLQRSRPASELDRISPNKNFKSKHGAGTHPFKAVSAAIWHRSARSKTTSGKKAKWLKTEGRWDNVPWADAGRLEDTMICHAVNALVCKGNHSLKLHFWNLCFSLGEEVSWGGIKTSWQPDGGSIHRVQCFFKALYRRVSKSAPLANVNVPSYPSAVEQICK